MTKLTLESLKILREKKKEELAQKTIKIIVGMGTCGIAAGAKESYDSIVDELLKNNISNYQIKQTGCMGLCYSEPTVEVIMDEMPNVIYGKVDPSVGRLIVNQHIVRKQLLNDHIFDKPSVDILKY